MTNLVNIHESMHRGDRMTAEFFNHYEQKKALYITNNCFDTELPVVHVRFNFESSERVAQFTPFPPTDNPIYYDLAVIVRDEKYLVPAFDCFVDGTINHELLGELLGFPHSAYSTFNEDHETYGVNFKGLQFSIPRHLVDTMKNELLEMYGNLHALEILSNEGFLIEKIDLVND